MDSFATLVRDNVTVLGQGLDVVESLDLEAYGRAVPAVDSTGIGTHIRHVLDYWSCLLRDRESGAVNFDGRERRLDLQVDPGAAAARLRELITEVEALADLDPESPLLIRMDSVAEDGVVPRSTSTLGREVHGLLSHTIHHFAIVAMLLRLAGRPVPEGFGIAPSTLRFWKETRPSASADS
ncbi:MAG: hypothetical protein ACYTDX_02685 [Planctomycetota bacterium]|jgi:hypothetical protein